ncbi:MAG: tetratricopeptide repeat protein [Acidobacteriota bacterium]
MSEHLTQNQIEGYSLRRLSAIELLSASDHLGVCADCRGKVERALDGNTAFFALKSEVLGVALEANSSPDRTHLTFEQIANCVDKTLAGEELQTVKDHLTSCEQCVMVVDDLRSFREEVAPALDREYRPSTIRTTQDNRWYRFVTMLSSLLPRPPALALGSALIVLLVIATGWLVWQTQEPEKKNPAITQTPSPPTTPVLTSGDPPAPPPDGKEEILLAQLNDGGGKIILDREGKLSGVEHLPSVYQQMVKRALTNQQLEKSPFLEELSQPGNLMIRSGDTQGKKFSVLEPVGKVTLSAHPTFHWSQLDNATSYIVEIYDNLTLVVTSPPLSDNSWTVSESLQRGITYSWQVKAIIDGQEFITPHAPAPQAKFRILDQAKANELAQARRNHASSHLTLALLYTQAGLLKEAELELRTLQKANPDSVIVQRLLTNLRALRS